MADFGVGATDEIARLSLGQGSESSPPAAPDISSQGLVALDITDKFDKAVQTLEPGELVKDGFFTLFEAVSALEIMDPKMDSGYLKQGDELEELYDVSRPLSPQQVLGIMDQLLCHEMAWHLGYPLSQTIFTSVYVEALLMPTPQTTEEAHFVRKDGDGSRDDLMITTLRAYCLGMLKACGYVNERIKSEHYYEEEDFVTNTYNRTLLSSIRSDDIRHEVDFVTWNLSSPESEAIGDDLKEALLFRLKLRLAFLDATESPQHMDSPALAKSPWQQGLALLDSIESSHSLGAPLDEAFSAKLQRKLASTMPPRPIVQLGFADAFGHLRRLFRDGAEVVEVLHYTDSQCLQTFVSNFQGKKPHPLVYIRTLLQTFLFDSMQVLGTMSIRQLLDDDLSIITLPISSLLDRSNDDIEATQDPRFVMAQQMEIFRKKAASPFLDILRTTCQNRCRIRRTLFHSLVQWDNLQADAEDIDQILQVAAKESPLVQHAGKGKASVEVYSLPLSSWAYLYKLKQMEAIVQMGFELEVYQVDELAGMYWYLNYLAKFRVQHAERIKTFAVRRFEEHKARSKQLDPTQERQLQRSLAHVRLSLLDAAVTWELSDALSCLYAVLLRTELVKAPPRPYSSDQLRYSIRMKPFEAIELPGVPSFEDFTAGTMQAETAPDELLVYAERALAGAKKGFEVLSRLPPDEAFCIGSQDQWLASVKNGLKSCIALGIAITSVRKALKGLPESSKPKIKADIPTPDKAYHEWWIIPKISPIS